MTASLRFKADAIRDLGGTATSGRDSLSTLADHIAGIDVGDPWFGIVGTLLKRRLDDVRDQFVDVLTEAGDQLLNWREDLGLTGNGYGETEARNSEDP